MARRCAVKHLNSAKPDILAARWSRSSFVLSIFRVSDLRISHIYTGAAAAAVRANYAQRLLYIFFMIMSKYILLIFCTAWRLPRPACSFVIVDKAPRPLAGGGAEIRPPKPMKNPPNFRAGFFASFILRWCSDGVSSTEFVPALLFALLATKSCSLTFDLYRHGRADSRALHGELYRNV